MNTDRLANAARLGEKCLELTCEVCEDINMLDIIEEFAQWPESLDAVADDIPVEDVSIPTLPRPSYAEVAKVSFADEMRAREVEARRIAASEVEARRLAELSAAERLAEIGRLKCEMESESARALVVEQTSQIARLTEQLELQRTTLSLSVPRGAIALMV